MARLSPCQGRSENGVESGRSRASATCARHDVGGARVIPGESPGSIARSISCLPRSPCAITRRSTFTPVLRKLRRGFDRWKTRKRRPGHQVLCSNRPAGAASIVAGRSLHCADVFSRSDDWRGSVSGYRAATAGRFITACAAREWQRQRSHRTTGRRVEVWAWHAGLSGAHWSVGIGNPRRRSECRADQRSDGFSGAAVLADACRSAQSKLEVDSNRAQEISPRASLAGGNLKRGTAQPGTTRSSSVRFGRFARKLQNNFSEGRDSTPVLAQIALKQDEAEATAKIENAFQSAGLAVPSTPEVLAKSGVESARGRTLLADAL